MNHFGASGDVAVSDAEGTLLLVPVDDDEDEDAEAGACSGAAAEELGWDGDSEVLHHRTIAMSNLCWKLIYKMAKSTMNQKRTC